MLLPMAKNENIVTERTTEGDNPAKIANAQSDRRIMANLEKCPFLELGIGFKSKFINPKIKPTCNPETDRI